MNIKKESSHSLLSLYIVYFNYNEKDIDFFIIINKLSIMAK